MFSFLPKEKIVRDASKCFVTISCLISPMNNLPTGYNMFCLKMRINPSTLFSSVRPRDEPPAVHLHRSGRSGPHVRHGLRAAGDAGDRQRAARSPNRHVLRHLPASDGGASAEDSRCTGRGAGGRPQRCLQGRASARGEWSAEMHEAFCSQK